MKTAFSFLSFVSVFPLPTIPFHIFHANPNQLSLAINQVAVSTGGGGR